MGDCKFCMQAEWDYEEYYGTNRRQYFISGCRLDREPEECDEYEEDADEWLYQPKSCCRSPEEMHMGENTAGGNEAA